MRKALIIGLLALGTLGASSLTPASAMPLSAQPRMEVSDPLVTEVQYGSRRGDVSPQAGIRCGNYGCWRNDRYGRPTGETSYYDNQPSVQYEYSRPRSRTVYEQRYIYR